MPSMSASIEDFKSGDSIRWISGNKYSPHHFTPDTEKIPCSVEALEVLAFGFPACSDERVILLWAIDSLLGNTDPSFRRWGR